MIGWLIYNGCLNFKLLHELYVQSAKNLGINLQCISNDRFAVCCIDGNQVVLLDSKKIETPPSFILFLDKDIGLAFALEQEGYKLFNSAQSIMVCDSKIETFKALSNHNIPLPTTLYAPLYFNNENSSKPFIDTVVNTIDFPIVVKQAFGSFGEQVYLANDINQLEELFKNNQTTPTLFQQFVKSSYGRDVRAIVVGGEVVASMERRSASDFRANAKLGGTVQKIDINSEFEQLAIKCCDILKLDFAGVDLLFNEDGTPILCEVNSNAHITAIQSTTNIDVSSLIIQHCKLHCK